MASQSGYNDAGSSGHGITSSKQLGSRDLQSKRLLGTVLASVVYETELHGEKVARKDFVGVPSRIFEKEAHVLVGLEDHINVVKTLGWTVNKMSCSLVLEYMDDDLVDELQRRKQSLKRTLKASPEAGTSSGNQSDRTRTTDPPFELPEAVDIMEQIARGMELLHDQGIPHGDLKTKNILVSRGDQNSVSVKVADFGLVRTKRKSTSFASRQARKLDMARWKAPEILRVVPLAEDNDETSSESDSESSDEECAGSSGVTKWRVLDGQKDADVYSFAVTCCQILTGEDPYPNPNWRQLMGRIVAGDLRPALPAACPPLLRELLVSCWASESYGGEGVAAFSLRPPFSFIRRTLEFLRRSSLLLTVDKESLSSFQHPLAMNVIGSLEFVMMEVPKAVRCLALCDHLGDLLSVILSDVENIQLQLSDLSSFHEQTTYTERVKHWLARLQHALHLTAIYVHECSISIPAHKKDHDRYIYLLSTKLQEQDDEIMDLRNKMPIEHRDALDLWTPPDYPSSDIFELRVLLATENDVVYIIKRDDVFGEGKTIVDIYTDRAGFAPTEKIPISFRDTCRPFAASNNEMYVGGRTIPGKENRVFVWKAAKFFGCLQGPRAGDTTWEYTVITECTSGSSLYCGCSDGTIEVWKRIGPNQPRIYDHSITGHSGAICALAVGKGGTLISVDDRHRNIVRVWCNSKQVASLDLKQMQVLQLACSHSIVPGASSMSECYLYILTSEVHPSRLWCNVNKILDKAAGLGSILSCGEEVFSPLVDSNPISAYFVVRSCLVTPGAPNMVYFLCETRLGNVVIEEWRGHEKVRSVEAALPFRDLASWTVSGSGVVYLRNKFLGSI